MSWVEDEATEYDRSMLEMWGLSSSMDSIWSTIRFRVSSESRWNSGSFQIRALPARVLDVQNCLELRFVRWKPAHCDRLKGVTKHCFKFNETNVVPVGARIRVNGENMRTNAGDNLRQSRRNLVTWLATVASSKHFDAGIFTHSGSIAPLLIEKETTCTLFGGNISAEGCVEFGEIRWGGVGTYLLFAGTVLNLPSWTFQVKWWKWSRGMHEITWFRNKWHSWWVKVSSKRSCRCCSLSKPSPSPKSRPEWLRTRSNDGSTFKFLFVFFYCTSHRSPSR